MKTAVRDQVNALRRRGLLHAAGRADEGQPAGARRTRRWSRSCARIGIVPGQDFDASKLDAGPSPQRVPRGRLRPHHAAVQGQRRGQARSTAGPSRPRPASTAPTTCSGRSSPRSASAPTGRRTRSTRPRTKDADGQAATAGPTSTSCTSRQGPAAAGRRLLVADDVRRDYFFVANPLNRYSVSPRNDLKANPDGSVDLYIQNESPGKDKEVELAAGARRASSS